MQSIEEVRMCPEAKSVHFGKFYFVVPRFQHHWDGRIVKIAGLGEGIPQRVFGLVFDVNTGVQYETLTETQLRGCLFAADIGKEVPQETLDAQRKNLHARIGEFFGQ